MGLLLCVVVVGEVCVWVDVCLGVEWLMWMCEIEEVGVLL